LGVTDSEPQAKGTSNEECGTPFSTGIAGSTGTTLVHSTLREVQVFVCLIPQSGGFSGARPLHAIARAVARGRSGNMAPARHADIGQRAPAGEPAAPGSLGAWRVPHSVDEGRHRTAGLARSVPADRPPHTNPQSASVLTMMPVTAIIHSSNHSSTSATGYEHPATAPTTDRKRSTRECPCTPTQQGKCQTLSSRRARGSPPRRRASYHRIEGAFGRSVTLPAAFDGTRVDAKYVDGILR
jgi:hypothetical protein